MDLETSRQRSSADVDILKKTLGSLPEPVTRPVMIMVSGLPGTGKSHFSHCLAKRFPAVVLETDALRKALFSSPGYTPEESQRLFQACHLLIEELLRRGMCIILDATNLLEHQREHVYCIADKASAQLIIVRAWAPEEVVAQRLVARWQRANPDDKSDATWDVYQRMKPAVERIRRNHLVVDTSKDIGPAIEKVLREAERSS
ncbi:MAG: ATP-binding protein [Chloroflexota bacterium]